LQKNSKITATFYEILFFQGIQRIFTANSVALFDRFCSAKIKLYFQTTKLFGNFVPIHLVTLR